MKKLQVLYLSGKDVVETGLTMKETIEVSENTYKAYATGDASLGKKAGLNMEVFGRPRDSGLTAMSAYVRPLGIAGLKWIGLNFENPAKRDLPSHTAMIILNDAESMAPLAIMEGGWITAMRTGAATGVGAKYLAREGASTVGVIGAGYQSRFQMLALKEVLPLDRILVTDVVKARCQSLAHDMTNELGVQVMPVESPRKAAENSDIIVTVTSADEPLVLHQWLRTGTLVCALTDHSNFDYDVTKKANKIVVDNIENTLHLGELAKWIEKGLVSEKNIYAEIGEVIAGKKRGRENAKELILYVPIGVGYLDVAVGAAVLELAKQRRLGQLVEFL